MTPKLRDYVLLRFDQQRIHCDTCNRQANNVSYQVSGSMGLDVGDRLQSGARKLKYVVNGPLPGDHAFPSFRDFEVRSLVM